MIINKNRFDYLIRQLANSYLFINETNNLISPFLNYDKTLNKNIKHKTMSHEDIYFITYISTETRNITFGENQILINPFGDLTLFTDIYLENKLVHIQDKKISILIQEYNEQADIYNEHSKALIRALTKYKKIDLEELIKECYKPSRVNYIITNYEMED